MSYQRVRDAWVTARLEEFERDDRMVESDRDLMPRALADLRDSREAESMLRARCAKLEAALLAMLQAYANGHTARRTPAEERYHACNLARAALEE